MLSPLAITSWPVAVAALLNAAAVVVLIRWYFVPLLRRRGWPVWTPCVLMFLGFLVFEPSRDTFSYGQVNLLLLVLVGKRPAEPEVRRDAPPTLWLTAVALLVAYWCWWVRSRKPETVLGFEVTGVIACLVSPITWGASPGVVDPGRVPAARSGVADPGRRSSAATPRPARRRLRDHE